MKILELKPKREVKQSCSYCDTVYLLEESDVTVKIDFLCDRVNLNCNDFLGRWKCPGCGVVAGGWLYELPWSWRDAIMVRSPGIQAEFEVLKKAEYEREARLNAEAECAAIQFPSKFDKLLGWFRFYCSWK